METRKILDGETGSGSSAWYGIDKTSVSDTEVQVFLDFVGGTVSLEASPDGVKPVAIKDGQFTSNEVVPVDLAEGSYLRVSYSGVTSITATVKPKADSNA